MDDAQLSFKKEKKVLKFIFENISIFVHQLRKIEKYGCPFDILTLKSSFYRQQYCILKKDDRMLILLAKYRNH